MHDLKILLRIKREQVKLEPLLKARINNSFICLLKDIRTYRASDMVTDVLSLYTQHKYVF
jgi:hypothetical protein